MRKLLLALALLIPFSATVNRLQALDPFPGCYPCPPPPPDPDGN